MMLILVREYKAMTCDSYDHLIIQNRNTFISINQAGVNLPVIIQLSNNQSPEYPLIFKKSNYFKSCCFKLLTTFLYNSTNFFGEKNK